MSVHPSRRRFLATSAAIASGLALPRISSAEEKKPLFQISLAEWSLHKALFGRKGAKIDNLDFATMAKKDFGIEAVEYVNQFFMDKAKDIKYLREMKKRASDAGVKSLLIMCDREGNLGDPDSKRRTQAVENHYKWVDAAKFLGCHSIRVNARSNDKLPAAEQMKLAANGLSRLTDFAKKQKINVLVENHGGLSSNGAWLVAVMKRVNDPFCGTLPDFGNFRISPKQTYDRYKGVTELMPFAKAVSAKSGAFDAKGNEVNTDYLKMMEIVLKAGYRGYVGIEYGGSKLSEAEGIRATKRLLERVREQLAKKFPK